MLIFSRWVESDLEAIADYIARHNPRRALSFIQEIRQEIDRIGREPLLFQLRPEIGPGARVGAVGRYIILFRIVDPDVRVERVVFGGRNLSMLSY